MKRAPPVQAQSAALRPVAPASALAAGLLPGGSGRPLDSATRAGMEARLGHDFAAVRVHDGVEAAAAAREMGARAFTLGEHVVLGAGGYGAGARLLAHELAHVVQQRGASRVEARVSEPGEASERAAEAAAAAVMAGRAPADLAAPAAEMPAVQRDVTDLTLPDYRLRPSPWFQRSMGRLVIDGFPMGKSTLTAGQKDQIKFHASILKILLDGEPGGRASVTGHGDAVGTEQRNLELGMERAKAVAQVLIDAGIPQEIIDLESAGESAPAVPARGAEPQNRRAVIGFSPPLGSRLGVPQLTAPTFDFEPKKPIDLGVGGTPGKKKETLQFPTTTIPPEPEPDKPGPRRDTSRDFDWKKAEKMVERAREIEKNLPKDKRSPVERLADAVVEALDPLIKELPVSEDKKKKVREGIKKGVQAGTEKGCEAAIDASGMSGPEAEGAKAVCKGVLQSKPGGTGGEGR